MVWEDIAMALIVSLTGANTLFLWSLHEKVTRMIEKESHCVFCQSDVNSNELESIRRIVQQHEHECS